MLVLFHDFKEIHEQFAETRFKKDINMFMRKALNNTASIMRNSTITDNMQDRYLIKKAAVKKTLSIRKASTQDLKASIISRGARLSLVDFKARQTKRGVNSTIKVDSTKTSLTHYFIATMKSGHKGVFKRSDTKNMISKPKRQALIESDTLSVPYGLQQKTVKKANNKMMTKILTKEMKTIGSIIYLKRNKKVWSKRLKSI